MRFDELGLTPEIEKALTKRGFVDATEIQSKVFSPIKNGGSVLGLSKTGSGKTLAYLLPLACKWVEDNSGAPQENEGTKDSVARRVLVLSPTRELAHQIHSEAQSLFENQKNVSVLIVGGDSEKQQLENFKTAHFVVATPGRLLDLIKNSHLDLSTFSHVVLDEADRLLDMGFQDDIKDIVRRLPKGLKIACLSATSHLGVEELIFEMGIDFEKINTGTDKELTVDNLDHRVAFIGDREKFHFLAHFIAQREDQRGIVFTNFRDSAHKISSRLQGLGFKTHGLSAQLNQSRRRQIMAEFRDKKVQVLVASDVAARGLDVEGLDFVVNYDLPDDSATYVHRVGRTARAGKAGVALSLVGFEDSFRLEKLENYLKTPIKREEVDTEQLSGPLPKSKNGPSVQQQPRHEGQRKGRGNQRHQNKGRTQHSSQNKTGVQNKAPQKTPAKKGFFSKITSALLSLFGVRTQIKIEEKPQQKKKRYHNKGRGGQGKGKKAGGKNQSRRRRGPRPEGGRPEGGRRRRPGRRPRRED